MTDTQQRDLHGLKALVTGATSGIGQEFARKSVGVNVAVGAFDINPDAACARDSDQRHAFGMRDIEVDARIASELRPPARAAHDRHPRRRETERIAQRPPQQRATEYVAAGERFTAKARRACLLARSEPAGYSRDFSVARG